MLHRENRKPLLSCGSLLMKEADVKNGRNFTEDLRLWDAQWLQYTKGEICQKYLLTQLWPDFSALCAAHQGCSRLTASHHLCWDSSLLSAKLFQVAVAKSMSFPFRDACAFTAEVIHYLSLIKQNLSVCVKEVYTFISYESELLPFTNPQR